jgi:catechol-2,3-dioxygenase
MNVMFQCADGAWLTNDQANHRLALLTSPQLSDDLDQSIHAGIHHCAFEFLTIDELLSTYLRLKAAHIEPRVCLDHGMTTSFYYTDPDAHHVELQVDTFGNWEESGEWMRTSAQFAANPHGTLIDPEQLVAARQAGVSFHELHRRAYAGEFTPAGPLNMRKLSEDFQAPTER